MCVKFAGTSRTVASRRSATQGPDAPMKEPFERIALGTLAIASEVIATLMLRRELLRGDVRSSAPVAASPTRTENWDAMVRVGFLLAVFWVSTPLAGQSVRVSVIDRTTRASVPGAILSLVRLDGTRLAVALSDERGLATLTAQAGQRVRVMVESIGFATSRSEEFELSPGIATLEVTLESRPLMLPRVAVRDRGRCESGASGEATAALWDEVRKALTATTLTTPSGPQLTVWHYVRRLDRSHRIIAETTSARGIVGVPFAAISPRELSEKGFTQLLDGAPRYFAPDAELLLDASFVQTHCFGVQTEGANRLVGLTFEPQPGRTTSDITGVLWLDAKSSDLRWIEFTYTQQPRAENDAKSGGRIEFERLPNGMWVVLRWHIRLPVIARGRGDQVGRLATPDREIVVGFREEGGWLTPGVTNAEASSSTSRLAGVVFDSVRFQPLAGARIVLGDGAAEARTDSAGRYSLGHFMPGRYLVRAEHPRLAALGSDPSAREVTLTLGRTATADWAVASRSTLRGRFCGAGGGGTARERSVIAQAVDSSSGLPIEGARTTARWRTIRLRTVDGTAVASTVDSVAESTSDANGFAMFCIGGDAPRLTLQIEHEGRETSRTVSFPDTVVLVETQLPVPTRLARRFHLQGRVLASSSGDNSIAAEILVPGLGRTYHTNEQGRFDIAGLAAGPLAVIIRSPGYQPLFTRTLIPQKDTLPTFALDRLPQSLQTVTVIGARDFRGFEERRAVQAGGTYISREDLASREGAKLSDFLRTVRGVRIVRRQDGAPVLASARGAFSRSINDCPYQIVLDGQRLYALRSGGPEGSTPPSIDEFAPAGLEAIEVYTGPATTPPQFGGLGAACGTIVLWTRR